MQKNNQSCRVFDDKSRQTIQKRRIVTDKECERDLKGFLIKLFHGVNNGVDKFNIYRSYFKQSSKVRGNDASNLNTSIIESLQDTFQDNWRWGKYKRFILRINSYTFFVKKLSKSGMPMNVKTKYSSCIFNQEQVSLFNDIRFGAMEDPIIYIGYEVDRYGEIKNLRLVYIDEGQVKWTIKEEDIKGINQTPIYYKPDNTQPPLVSLKDQAVKKESI